MKKSKSGDVGEGRRRLRRFCLRSDIVRREWVSLSGGGALAVRGANVSTVSSSRGSGSVRPSYFQSELTRFHVRLRVNHVTVRLTNLIMYSKCKRYVSKYRDDPTKWGHRT